MSVVGSSVCKICICIISPDLVLFFFRRTHLSSSSFKVSVDRYGSYNDMDTAALQYGLDRRLW
jgi:hypothetical protein